MVAMAVYFLQSHPSFCRFYYGSTHHQSGQGDRPTQRGGRIYSRLPQLKRIYQSCQIPDRQTNTFLPLLLGWRFTKLVGIDDLITAISSHVDKYAKDYRRIGIWGTFHDIRCLVIYEITT